MNNGTGRSRIPAGIVPDDHLPAERPRSRRSGETFGQAAVHDLEEISPRSAAVVGWFQRHWRLAIGLALGGSIAAWAASSLWDSSKAYRPPAPWAEKNND